MRRRPSSPSSPRPTPGGWSGCCATWSSTPSSTARAGTSWSRLARRRGGAVAVAVRDYGVGLKPGEATRVFNRFWRADPARARTTGGTGLGLSIAVEDARLHGGWLQAWGEPGGGSQFRLTLPRTADEPLRGSPIPLEPEDSRRNRGLDDAGSAACRGGPQGVHVPGAAACHTGRRRARPPPRSRRRPGRRPTRRRCPATVPAWCRRAGANGARRRRAARARAPTSRSVRAGPSRRPSTAWIGKAGCVDTERGGERGEGTGSRCGAPAGEPGRRGRLRCSAVRRVLLAGCASMPDSGDVTSVDAVAALRGRVAGAGLRRAPAGRCAAAEIVRGFLEATTSDEADFAYRHRSIWPSRRSGPGGRSRSPLCSRSARSRSRRRCPTGEDCERLDGHPVRQPGRDGGRQSRLHARGEAVPPDDPPHHRRADSGVSTGCPMGWCSGCPTSSASTAPSTSTTSRPTTRSRASRRRTGTRSSPTRSICGSESSRSPPVWRRCWPGPPTG